MIPILELKTQYAEIREEVEKAVCQVLARTHYILGPEVTAFEEEFAAWHGSPHAVGVASGTDALMLALRALGIGKGDEVLMPAFTFMATGGSVSCLGARPIFVDIDPETYTIDPALLESKITPQTKAITVVHLYGHPADMNPILEVAKKHNLKVIEDCAQATGSEYHGKKVGTMGDAGCFSFFPSKNLGGVGDGGMVLTAHAEVAERVQSLRGHGSRRKYFHDELGTNSRLDEMQAAVLRIKLRHLQSWNEKRRAVAAAYTQAISQFVQVPGDGPGCRHVYHQYTVRTSRRDALMDQLQKDGIGAIIYYPLALHQQKVYLDMGLGGQPLAETERAQREVLSLPMFPELNQSQIDQVISSLAGFFQNQSVQAG